MLKMTIYRFIRNKNKFRTRILILLALITFIFAAHKGYVTEKYKSIVYNNLKQKDIEYIDKTSDNAAELFLKLSLAKGIVAVIEGSSINVDAVIGGELEVGDIVQPIYDGIDIIWRIALMSTVSLKVQAILIKNTDLSFFKYAMMLSGMLFIPIVFANNAITNFFARIAKSIIVLTALIYLLLPLSIYINSLGTEYINNNYRNEAISNLDHEIVRLEEIREKLFQLEKVQEEKKKGFFSTGIKEKIAALRNKFTEINTSLKDISKNIINNLPVIITVYIINTLLLPIGILFILYKVLVFVAIKEAIDVRQYNFNNKK